MGDRPLEEAQVRAALGAIEHEAISWKFTRRVLESWLRLREENERLAEALGELSHLPVTANDEYAYRVTKIAREARGGR